MRESSSTDSEPKSKKVKHDSDLFWVQVGDEDVFSIRKSFVEDLNVPCLIHHVIDCDSVQSGSSKYDPFIIVDIDPSISHYLKSIYNGEDIYEQVSEEDASVRRELVNACQIMRNPIIGMQLIGSYLLKLKSTDPLTKLQVIEKNIDALLFRVSTFNYPFVKIAATLKRMLATPQLSQTISSITEPSSLWHALAELHKKTHPLLYHIGNLLWKGLEGEKDVKKALGFFEEAATSGNPFAQYTLGIIYVNGEDAEKDIQKGVDFLVAVLKNKSAPNSLVERVQAKFRAMPKHKEINWMSIIMDLGSSK